jgi:membrane associated rhomboid family serine protease
MSLFIGFQKPCIQCSRSVNNEFRRQFAQVRCTINPGSARHASKSSRPSKPPQSPSPKKVPAPRKGETYARKRQIDPSKRASIFLNQLSKEVPKTYPVQPDIISGEDTVPSPKIVIDVKSSSDSPAEETVEVEIDEKEEAMQRQIVENRRKLLWPGIWTFLAVTGTCGTFAFLDGRFGNDISSGTTQLPERAHIPQTWWLTPTVVTEGLKAGWNELDKLTIGVTVVVIGIHFLKKSPLPIWERLIHITGEKRYTAFTYPYVHNNWGHTIQNMFGLCWFLPGVMYYLGDNKVQAAAVFTSIPLVTSYLQHFAFRWGTVKGIPLNMGASGAVAAMMGAFCMAYPNEKVWIPNFIVLRVDAMYCGVLFAASQLYMAAKMPAGGGNRPAAIVSCVLSYSLNER